MKNFFKNVQFEAEHDFDFEKAIYKLDNATDFALETLLKLRVECEELRHVNENLRAEIEILKNEHRR